MAESMGKVTVDTPIPYLLSDLSNILNNEMGKLDKASTSAPYFRIKTRLEELKADPRYQFLFSGMLVGDTMAEVIARMFRLPARGRDTDDAKHPDGSPMRSWRLRRSAPVP